MKHLTLQGAIGQTLLARIDIGEEILLRFTESVVTLRSNYESLEIMDYVDTLDHPLENLQQFCDSQLDEIQAAGFIDADQKATASAQREERLKACALRNEEAKRKQYELLRAYFEKSDPTNRPHE